MPPGDTDCCVARGAAGAAGTAFDSGFPGAPAAWLAGSDRLVSDAAVQINFDLVFEVVNGRWCLDGISIATPQASPLAQATQLPPTAPVSAISKPAPKPR
jgi:hypothetical protein